MSETACSIPLGRHTPLPGATRALALQERGACASHFAPRWVPELCVLLGLKKILEVGSTVCGAPGSLPVTENTRMSASVLLSKLYEDLKCDAERENFHHLCEDYVR